MKPTNGRSDAATLVETIIHNKETSVLGSFVSKATSIAGDFASKASGVGAGIISLTSAAGALPSDINAHWSKDTAAISSLGDRVQTEWDRVNGWSKIKSDVRSVVAQGTASVDAFFSTQTAIAKSEARSIEADIVRTIISAASAATTATSTPTSSSSGSGSSGRSGSGSAPAAVPHLAIGSLVAAIGIVAGILVL